MKSGDVMCNSIDCVMSLLFITTMFFTIFYIIVIHSVQVTMLQFCMTWLAYEFFIFSLLSNSLIMYQQHLGCPKYSSLSQILHSHVTLSVSCDNMYKHTHSSWIHQVFSFSFHHQQCLYQNESISDQWRVSYVPMFFYKYICLPSKFLFCKFPWHDFIVWIMTRNVITKFMNYV